MYLYMFIRMFTCKYARAYDSALANNVCSIVKLGIYLGMSCALCVLCVLFACNVYYIFVVFIMHIFVVCIGKPTSS